MSTTTFVNGVTTSDEDWFNDVDRVVYDILNDPTDLATLKNTILAASSTGTLGLGGTAASNIGVRVNHTGLNTAFQYSFIADATFSSAATTEGVGFQSQSRTAVAAFTCTSVSGFQALNASKGAGSTITTQYGFRCNDLTSGISNIAFKSEVSAGTDKYNLYIDGTATNHFAGPINAAGGVVASALRTGAGTPTSASAAGTAGDISWDASFIYVCTATNTWKRVAIATW